MAMRLLGVVPLSRAKPGQAVRCRSSGRFGGARVSACFCTRTPELAMQVQHGKAILMTYLILFAYKLSQLFVVGDVPSRPSQKKGKNSETQSP